MNNEKKIELFGVLIVGLVIVLIATFLLTKCDLKKAERSKWDKYEIPPNSNKPKVDTVIIIQ
jgi:hypothetical protein